MPEKPLKAFVVYSTYRIEDEKAFVYLFGKLENGESFLSISEYKAYFFIKKSDLEKAKKIEKFETEETSAKNFKDEPLTKLVFQTPKQLTAARDRLEEQGITTFESDIRFAYRFMIDKEIKGSFAISGKYKKGNYVDRIYENPEIAPANFFPKLKILALDIETDPKATEIYCISLATDNYRKVLIRSDKKLSNAICYDSERGLLEGFKKKIQQLNPDIITGWNVIDFDLKIIERRFKKYRISFSIGRADWEASLRIYNDFFRDSKAEIPGRMVLDGIHLLKSSFIALDDYTLDNAAKTFVGEKKLIGKEHKGEKIVEYFRKNPQMLADYNLKDSELVLEILKKTGTVELTIQRSLLTGMQLDRVSASVASLDSMYLRETKKRGIVCNNSAYNEKETPLKGGFVRDSVPGLYENIIVLDFKSLYPSIMRTFNIDPYSFLDIDETEAKKNPEKFIVAPNGAVFKNTVGILPGIIQELWDQREESRKKGNELARYAIKILMNSIYGVLGNPSCRFFSMKMGNAITHFAQFLIKLTAEKIKEKGFEVIYGDTDSVFVKTEAKTTDQAEKIGKDLQSHVNNFYEKFILEAYKTKSFMELELDKIFKHFLMPRIRGSEKGAKKRYAGIIVKHGKEKMEFTGLEAKRSDWTELAKKFQQELLAKIFNKEKYEQYIQEFVKDLKKGKYDKLLVYKKKINKPLDEYIKTTPPHVKAARKLEKLSSNLIQYVMTVEGPEPIEKLENRIDYEHYVEKQLKPIADSILSFLDTEFDDVFKKTKQTSLGEF